ncbi:g9121 [Coccomyxa elongata]
MANVDEKTRRVRSLLSSYYGVEGAPSQGGSPRSEQSDTPSARSTSRLGGGRALAGLDSAAFDVDRYLQSLLRTTRLDALLAKHTEMSSEIKNLDSDMQMLVYENYNRFISATDTIRTMKSNVDGMDSSMQELEKVTESVAERSEAVNSKLQLRRDQIEELSQVKNLLTKLQAVFDLPRRLSTALDQGALEIAADAYADAAPLLKRYGHKGAFRKVAVEANACAKELTGTLKQRMLHHKEEAAECIQMLRKLGEPVESLQEDFLACMKMRMANILGEAEAVVTAMAVQNRLRRQSGAAAEVAHADAWGLEPGKPPSLSRFVVELDQRFLTELTHTTVLFNELFDQSGRRQLLKATREKFTEYIALMKTALKDAAEASAAHSAGIQLHPPPPGANAEDHPTPDPSEDWGASVLAEALYTASNDVARVQSLLPELSPADRGTEVVEAVLRHHIGACFAALERRVLDLLHEVLPQLHNHEAAKKKPMPGAQQAHPLIEAFEGIAQILMAGTDSVLHAMELYTKRAWVLRAWQDVFVDLVQGQLQQLFLSLLSRFWTVSGLGVEGLQSQPGLAPAAATSAGGAWDVFARPSSPVGNAKQPEAGLLLLLARVCSFMESTALVHVMETLAATFPGQGGGSGSGQPPAFVAGEVARRLHMAMRALVGGYVEAHGRRLSAAVRAAAAAADPADQREPRAPQPVCGKLLQALAAARDEAALLIDDSAAAQSSSGRGEEWYSSAAAGSREGMERNVARLFQERGPIFGEVELTQASVLAGITRIGIKSFVESVRLQTLNRQGLQQLQVDVHFLRPQLRRYAQGPEGAVVSHLLDEVVAAAVERSLEPILLDGHILDRLASAPPAQ